MITAGHRLAIIAALLVSCTLSCATLVSAGQPASCLPWRFFTKAPVGTSPKCGCCDDYGPKPLPKVCNECRGCCDDYCPKPMPRTCPVDCGTCDDYRPKPWQPLPWCPPCLYRCLPGGCAPH